jgi:hypothetical protein
LFRSGPSDSERDQQLAVLRALRDAFVRRLARREPSLAAEVAARLADENLRRLTTVELRSVRAKLAAVAELGSLERAIVDLVDGAGNRNETPSGL